MKKIELPAGTLHLDIDDIADFVAQSLWPLRDDGSAGDGLNYGFCYATLRDEIKAAIESKELPARDPLTFGLHANPYGENVKHALVRVDDLRKYLADRGMDVEVPAPVTAATVVTANVKLTEATGGRGAMIKKSALISRYQNQWASIESSLNNAVVNGLSEAAKAEKHGYWYEADAKKWASDRGLISGEKQSLPPNSVFNLPGTKHTS